MARVNAIPETVNISELRQRQNELLGRLDSGPVLLMQYSTPAALLVGVDQWNQLAGDLEDLEDTITALKVKLALAQGDTDLVDWSEVEAELEKADRVPLAA
jgi:PHD/YefM family antitoxin component YafN of YafNO toxin-antitoxin module